MSVLREACHDKHKEVEALPLIQHLMHGAVTTGQYVIYLAEMQAIYTHLETLVQQKGLFENLDELPRAKRILDDLNELTPGYQATLTNSTCSYLNYLTELHDSDNWDKLFAHVYVRHLGDMYGGKILSRRFPGAGRWYEFADRADLVKRFNARLTMDLADEAINAFDHFGKIFHELWPRIYNCK
jgi:heme oxygenase